MKDILFMLVLMTAQITKLCSQPYQPDSNGNCLEPTTEYRVHDSGLCCKKCPSGHRMKQECSVTTETECEQCPAGQYMEKRNYHPNCLPCKKCKGDTGQQYARNCSSTTKAQCECQPGWYCIMGYGDLYCDACNKYMSCKAGYGVSVPGTANSDVKCKRCPNGTFSDTVSDTDRCRPHANCQGRVARKGDSTSDNVCQPETLLSDIQHQASTKDTPHTQKKFPTASATMSTVLVTSNAPPELIDYTPSIIHLPSLPETVLNQSTKSPQPSSTVSDSVLAYAIGSVVGFILLFIAIVLLIRCKSVWKNDAAEIHSKVDANGNCESGKKINQGYYEEIHQQTSFTVTSPEQQCLMEKGDTSSLVTFSDQSQSSSTNTGTLTGTDGCSSFDSIGPLQSTLALHNPPSESVLSEPMVLLSNTEPQVTPQTSFVTQCSVSSCSSQPTSPQVLSPVTTSPHVNVNITFNIGNGGAPSFIPTELTKIDSKIPFGEEEETFSIPQQENGKQSLVSVQESECCSA